jgi:hypothetical protein
MKWFESVKKFSGKVFKFEASIFQGLINTINGKENIVYQANMKRPGHADIAKFQLQCIREVRTALKKYDDNLNQMVTSVKSVQYTRGRPSGKPRIESEIPSRDSPSTPKEINIFSDFERN